MRCDGKTFHDISQELGYSENSIRADLTACVKFGPRLPNVVYPGLLEYIISHYGGSIRNFSLDCGVSPNTSYSVLSGRTKPGKEYISKVLDKTGLSMQAAFGGW